MKFKPMSDLHLDIAKFKMPLSDDDAETVLLLAGDICEGKGARNFIEPLCARFKYVVYCLGNHEFYNKEYFALVDDWKIIEKKLPNFHFLHDSAIEIEDVKILGGCMWTNFNDNEWFAVNASKQNMNDYNRIRILNDSTLDSRDIYRAKRRIGRKFQPDDSMRIHANTIEFMEEELAKEWDGKILVMTHHLPSELSIAPRYKNNALLNYSYFSALEWMMEKYNVDVWVHGHSHHSVDYLIDFPEHTTRVISNARGYVPYETESMTNFDPNKLFDL